MGAENIKGPWRRASHRQIMDAEGSVVCEVWSSVGIKEADANENVIAAAPDLFAAFEALHEKLENLVAAGAIPMPADLRARALSESVESMRGQVVAVLAKVHEVEA